MRTPSRGGGGDWCCWRCGCLVLVAVVVLLVMFVYFCAVYLGGGRHCYLWCHRSHTLVTVRRPVRIRDFGFSRSHKWFFCCRYDPTQQPGSLVEQVIGVFTHMAAAVERTQGSTAAADPILQQPGLLLWVSPAIALVVRVCWASPPPAAVSCSRHISTDFRSRKSMA